MKRLIIFVANLPKNTKFKKNSTCLLVWCEVVAINLALGNKQNISLQAMGKFSSNLQKMFLNYFIWESGDKYRQSPTFLSIN